MQNQKSYTLPSFWHNAVLKKIDLSSFLNKDKKETERFLKNARHGCGNLSSPTPFITWTSPQYPDVLRQQPHAPPVLFYKGALSLLEERIIALVGTRRCTQNGKNIASQLASMINAGQLCTISGLAYGIDEAAHQASLSKTIGVLPCGFSATPSPQLARQGKQIIDNNGLLLSEFLPQDPPRKWRFIKRNRIIAWLAEELIIVEAPEKSGALHTAQFALQARKSIWAVPGSPLNHTNMGCLNLIQAGVRPLCSLKQFALHLGISYTAKEVFRVSEFAKQLNVHEATALRILSNKVLSGQIKILSHGYYQWI